MRATQGANGQVTNPAKTTLPISSRWRPYVPHLNPETRLSIGKYYEQLAHIHCMTHREDSRVIDPVEAFSLLANETRMAVISALWEARGGLAFSEIQDRAGISDTGNFNYHLDQLRGHFVVKGEDDRYQLTAAGRSAMLVDQTGELTQRRTLDLTQIEYPCPYCDNQVAIAYGRDEVLRLLCLECEGTYPGPSHGGNGDRRPSMITKLRFPPAGVVGRSPNEIAEIATSWTIPRMWMTLGGVCPDCAAATERTIHVCPAHDSDDGRCPTCEARFGVRCEQRCRRCRYGFNLAAFIECLRDDRLRRWFLDRGYDLTLFRIDDWTAAFPDGDTILHQDPLEYRVRWRVNGDSLVVRTDETLSMIELDSQ